MPKHHKLVVCKRCSHLYVTRIGAMGCACSGRIVELEVEDACAYIDAVDNFTRVTDLHALIAAAAPAPLAHGPRIPHFCQVRAAHF